MRHRITARSIAAYAFLGGAILSAALAGCTRRSDQCPPASPATLTSAAAASEPASAASPTKPAGAKSRTRPAAVGSIVTTQPAEGYINPLLLDGADPAVLFHDGTYYLYNTNSTARFNAVYTSSDLVHWTKKPIVFNVPPGPVWAPDIFYCRQDGKFYLYYSAMNKIGVAVADRPDGPFNDHGIIVHRGYDPNLFEDPSGKYYLYFSDGMRIYVLRMTTPVAVDGYQQQLLVADQPWEAKGNTINENPWIVKHNGLYYLVYSGGGAATPDYAVGYATSKSPLGPFTKYKGNPIVRTSDTVLGPGGGCITRDAANNLWHVYHQKATAKINWGRVICIDPMWFDENGVLHGKATRGTAQPAPKSTPTKASSGK